MKEQSISTPEKIKQSLPNSGGALTLGIISIVAFCCCAPGIVGLICAILGLILANRAISEYNNNPELYTNRSFSNAKTGKTCAIIGLILSLLSVILLIIAIVTGIFSKIIENITEGIVC